MTAPVLQFKRGLLANLPGLRAGEPGFTTDSYDLYVGIDSSLASNKFFGSHRYWIKETNSTGSGVNLVEGTSNGSNYITLQSPDSLAGIVTYYLPGTQGASSSVLTNDGSGNLTWSSGSDSPVFTGIATFTDTTENTLGDANTGSVQIDGGLGINKNVTVGGNLNVQGYSEFVGVVTFKGGVINIGDSDTDNINIGGEFVSDLIPNDDDSYDIGKDGKRWRNANFTGIATFVAGANIDSITFGYNGGTEINTTFGNLVLDSVGGTVNINDDITVSGVSTFSDNLDVNSSIDASGSVVIGENLSVSGVSTFTGDVTINSPTGITSSVNIGIDLYVAGITTVGGALDVNGGANISGGETILSSATVSDLTDNRVVVAGTSGSLEDSANLTFDGSTLTVVGLADLDDVNVSSGITAVSAVITNATITNTTFGSGTAIAGVDTDLNSVSASDDTLASAKAIKTYVDAQVTAQDLDFAGDSGTGAIDLDSQTFTIAGTANEIETSASGQTITVGLPDNVIVGSALTVTGFLNGSSGATLNAVQIGITAINEIDTSNGDLVIDSQGGTTTIDDELVVSGDVRINGNDIKSSDGTTNITLTSNTLTAFAGDIRVGGNDIQDSNGNNVFSFDGSQNVTANNNLTVNGNLYVSGNTTQVNTSSMTVEDRTIELGIVDGSTPSSATTWDLGVLFNYNSSGAKKSGVVWEHSESRFIFASELSDGGGTDNNSPQISFTSYAPIEIEALWVNDCAGQSQVISCTSGERFLENITIDAGTF